MENKTKSIQFWDKYTLTIREAAEYFNLGEHKLRRLIQENQDAEFILWNGDRPLIKRGIFEKYIDHASVV